MRLSDEERDCAIEALEAMMQRLKPSLKSVDKWPNENRRQFYVAKYLRDRIRVET